VLLLTTDEAGDPVALGSGFFVASDRIVTNYHVIKDASQIFVKFAGRKRLYKILFPGLPDRRTDLAILRIDEVKGKPLKLGSLSRLRVGDEIYVMGNPEGLEGTFSRGNISAFRVPRSIPDADLFDPVPEYIQITAPISHGSSGGPVLDERGEVIGVAAGILSEGQNLNFAIPVSKLAPLLKPENDLLAGMSPDSAMSSQESKAAVPEWEFVTSNGATEYYISRKRAIPTPEHTIILWTKEVPSDSSEGRMERKRAIDFLIEKSVNRNNSFSYTMSQEEFDCGHQRRRLLRIALYDQDGVLLYDEDLSDTAGWKSALPDSVGEVLLSFACKGRR
jgi:hypothetical protein